MEKEICPLFTAASIAAGVIGKSYRVCVEECKWYNKKEKTCIVEELDRSLMDISKNLP